MDLLGSSKHGEGVDESEQLDLEGLVLHRPVHQLVGPEGGVEQSGLATSGEVEELGADFDDPPFDRGVIGRRSTFRSRWTPLTGGVITVRVRTGFRFEEEGHSSTSPQVRGDLNQGRRL